MDLPLVTFRLPDGGEVPGGPGGLVGRMSSAALFVDDPRISEAHAMVSLRGGELHLLALRGGPGLRGCGGRAPSRSRCSPPPARSMSRFPGMAPSVAMCGWGAAPDAAASLWTTAGDGWRLRLRGEETRRLAPGAAFVVDGARFEVVELPAAGGGVAPTLATSGSAERALTLVLRFGVIELPGRRGGRGAGTMTAPASTRGRTGCRERRRSTRSTAP